MEYIKDYNYPIKYYMQKANVVVDVISRKSVIFVSLCGACIFQQFEDLGVDLQPLRKGVMLVNMLVPEPIFIQEIKKSQLQDPNLVRVVKNIAEHPDFKLVDLVVYF